MHVFCVEKDAQGHWISDLIGREIIRACAKYIEPLSAEIQITWIFGGGHHKNQANLSWSTIYNKYIQANYYELIKAKSVRVIDEESFRGNKNKLALDTKGELRFLDDYIATNLEADESFDKIISITTAPHIPRVALLLRKMNIDSHLLSAEEILTSDCRIKESKHYQKFVKAEHYKFLFTKYIDINGSVLELLASLMDTANLTRKF